MRPLLAPLLLVMGACATQEPDIPTGRARFAEYPESLFVALETACTGPAQSFSRPEPDLVECREYLPPEPTAAIILNFDGTPEDLPQLVIRFRTKADGRGYLVENDVFLAVPQKDGSSVQVRQRDNRFSRMLDTLYSRAGGVPET